MLKQLVFSLLATILTQSAEAKWLSEIPAAPARSMSKLFNIPTWIAHIDGKNTKKNFFLVCLLCDKKLVS